MLAMQGSRQDPSRRCLPCLLSQGTCRIRAETWASGSTPAKVGGSHTLTTISIAMAISTAMAIRNRHTARICRQSVSRTPFTIIYRSTETMAISC